MHRSNVMSGTAILDPAYLLCRANQARGLAEGMNDSWAKKALREIAQLYEWLANEMESEENSVNERDEGGIIPAHPGRTAGG